MFGNDVPTVQPGDNAARLAEGWTLLDVRTDDEWAGVVSLGRYTFPWIS